MPRTQLSIASCNLFNLNLPNRKMYRDKKGWTHEQYQKKSQWLASKLTAIDADVWGFQELWHTDALREVFERASLLNDYHILAPSEHKGANIICAGAVKKNLLVDEPKWIETFPKELILKSDHDEDPQTSGTTVSINTFSRPVLHFKIKPRSRGKIIHVYVCHLKSKRPTDIYREPWYDRITHSKHREAIGAALSTIRRTAEATALKIMLTEKTKNTDTPVIIIGDLNDSIHSNTLNIITGQPNYLLSGFSKGGSDVDLYSVATLQRYRSQRDVYYTHIYQNYHDSLDHILVSQEFYDNSRRRIWAYRSMEIVNDHLNRDKHKSDGSTDHGIVYAQFEYRPAKK